MRDALVVSVAQANMPADDTQRFVVRMSAAEKRHIRTLAVSQGLTLRQATLQAFQAWELQLLARSLPADPARGAPASTDSKKPGQPNHPATPRQDRRSAEAKPSSTPGGGHAPNADGPSINWLLRAGQLDW